MCVCVRAYVCVCACAGYIRDLYMISGYINICSARMIIYPVDQLVIPMINRLIGCIREYIIGPAVRLFNGAG